MIYGLSVCPLLLFVELLLLSGCCIVVFYPTSPRLVSVMQMVVLNMVSQSDVTQYRSTWVGFVLIFSFTCMFCKSLFVPLSFFFCPLRCLFYDLRILINPLVSSNYSYSSVNNLVEICDEWKLKGTFMIKAKI